MSVTLNSAKKPMGQIAQLSSSYNQEEVHGPHRSRMKPVNINKQFFFKAIIKSKC